MKRSISAHIR